MYLLTGKQHEQYKRMYVQSIDSMLSHLYSHTPQGTAYIADLEGGQKDHKMDHLVCFVPGMLALAVKHGVVEYEQATRHMDAAKELMRTCYNMYHLQQPSGIGAEYSRFSPEMAPGHDASYKLRPETVESLFVMWRVTGDVTYREWGWEIWSNIDKHCRVDGGYAALVDVAHPDRKEDKMESFFLAETLKYLYLLFEDDSLIPIFPTDDQPDYYVFNTECHPIKVHRPHTLAALHAVACCCPTLSQNFRLRFSAAHVRVLYAGVDVVAIARLCVSCDYIYACIRSLDCSLPRLRIHVTSIDRTACVPCAACCHQPRCTNSSVVPALLASVACNISGPHLSV